MKHKHDYSLFLKWIKNNGEVRNINRLANAIGEYPQRLHYCINRNTYMNDKVIDKIVRKFNLSEEEKHTFFYK